MKNIAWRRGYPFDKFRKQNFHRNAPEMIDVINNNTWVSIESFDSVKYQLELKNWHVSLVEIKKITRQFHALVSTHMLS